MYYKINDIVPKLEHAGQVREGSAKFAKQLEAAQMTAAKQLLGCSSTTSGSIKSRTANAPKKTKREVRKFKWQYIGTCKKKVAGYS